jgi:hypothetical protein
VGLNFAEDLDAWRSWQQRQNPLRRFRSALRPDAPSAPWLAVRGTSPRLLVTLDAPTPTQRASLLRPLELLGHTDAAVLIPSRMSGLLPGEWRWIQVDNTAMPEELESVRTVLAVGHYLPMGQLAENYARRLAARFVVVQHGLLTPHAPPLPRDAHLLAFSEPDAGYARSGRTDVTYQVVGSQLLWDAVGSVEEMDPLGTPLFLGQLHGAELPRRGKARTAGTFCRSTGASYRPHPAETDILSRLQHAAWERQGVKIDRSTTPLKDLNRPVVSAFSTGVLEAAARGIPSWVSYENPPSWLGEFWDRYGMAPWGGDPTPAPARPRVEPALAIAQILEELMGDPS